MVSINLVENKLDFESKKSLEFKNRNYETLTVDEFSDKIDVRCNHLESFNLKEKNSLFKNTKAVFRFNFNESILLSLVIFTTV